MFKWLAKKVSREIDLGTVLDLHALKEEVQRSADYHAKAALRLAKAMRNSEAYLGSGYDLYIAEDQMTPALKKKGYTKVVAYKKRK